MTSTQYKLLLNRTTELASIADTIQSLNASEEWTEIFTNMCFYRGWVRIKNKHLSQMKNVSSCNSEAVLHLATYGKKVGLDMLEVLSAQIPDEQTRLKAVQLILSKGVKPSKNELDSIVAEAENTRSLFDGASTS